MHLLAFCCLALFAGQGAKADIWAMHQGGRPPLLVATSATGPWANKHPFDPKTFGIVRGFSPSTEVTGSCILVYTRKLDPNLLNLLAKLNAISKTTPGFEPCYVHLFDAKGAQRGGYSVEELQKRIEELQNLAKKHELTHTSLGITASAKEYTQFGLDDANEYAIVLLTDKNKTEQPIVEWHCLVREADLTEARIREIEGRLQANIKK